MAPPNDSSTTLASPDEKVQEAIIGDNVAAKSEEPPATEMIYYTYDGNFQLDCDAEILACQFIDEKHNDETSPATTAPPVVHICMNRTVLHAQGGGQPTDTGTIEIIDDDDDDDEAKKKKIQVTKVLLDRATGVAHHTGRLVVAVQPNDTVMASLTSDLVGRSVRVMVDAENRQILSECHTAGHVVDSAMARCARALPSLKAYHFLDGPYVEYKGSIPQEERAELLERLQAAFVELVEEDIATEINVLSRADAQCLCDRVAANYFDLQEQFPDADADVRIVTVAGWPCPCGGTHVKSTGALKARQWGITGFRVKKGVVRVRYNVNWKEATTK